MDNNDELKNFQLDLTDTYNELICGRCYETVDKLYPPSCIEKPEDLLGAPLGMYHCPDCGAMVIAGVPHPYVCIKCRDRVHPHFDGEYED